MKAKILLCLFGCILVMLMSFGCAGTKCCLVQTKTITIYDNQTIPANLGMSTGVYINVDGYRYVNVAVEFEQHAADEEPLSTGVVFAHSTNGRLGARTYFNFEQNFSAPANPQFIDITGRNSWHGSQQNISSYIARLPIMGPFLQVFPFNHHNQDRRFSIILYLTN